MNRTYARFALLVAIAMSVTALAQTSKAASAPSTPAPLNSKIGIINIKGAIVACNEGQRDFEALQKRFDPKNSELKSRNDELDGLKKQLQAQGDKMNEEARTTLVRQIDQKQTALKRFVEDTQNDMQAQENEVGKNIGTKLMKTLDKWARDNGYALIMDYSSETSSVLWVGQGVDVTQEVVTAYNQESGVPPPARTAAAPAAPSATKPAPKPTTPPKGN
jgi:outer membrane protein